MGGPISLRDFAFLVRRALANLYDYPCLEASPLAELLLGDQPLRTRGIALHNLLLESIAAMRPTGAEPSHVVRRYQYLYLRYVDVRGTADIVGMLGISLRQARRDHHEALDALVSRLYEQYLQRGHGVHVGKPIGPPPHDDTLTAEVERIGRNDEPWEADLHEVLQSVVETIKPLTASRPIPLELAASTESMTIATDRTLLRQVFLHAIEHVLATADPGVIRIACDRTPRQAVVRITFPTSQHGRAQVPSNDQLDSCRALLALVPGDLEVQRTGRRGCYRIVLPVVPPATVLVVDDNPDVRQLFRRYLFGSSYRVVEARGFDQALQAARTLRPDVLTLDVMLPTHDGWELLQRLKRDPVCTDIPVIVCSVLHQRDLAFALGAVDVLEKPVSAEALRTAIGRQLRRRTAQPR